MSYEVSFLEEEGVILIKNEGELDKADYEAQAVQSSKLAQEKKVWLFFVDDTRLENQASFFQINELPEIYERIGFDPSTKMAVLKSKYISKASTDVDFFSTVCRTRGYSIKLFTDKSEAFFWLKNSLE